MHRLGTSALAPSPGLHTQQRDGNDVVTCTLSKRHCDLHSDRRGGPCCRRQSPCYRVLSSPKPLLSRAIAAGAPATGIACYRCGGRCACLLSLRGAMLSCAIAAGGRAIKCHRRQSPCHQVLSPRGPVLSPPKPLLSRAIAAKANTRDVLFSLHVHAVSSDASRHEALSISLRDRRGPNCGGCSRR